MDTRSRTRIKRWLNQILKAAYLLELVAIELAYEGKILLAYNVMQQANKIIQLVEQIKAELGKEG